MPRAQDSGKKKSAAPKDDRTRWKRLEDQGKKAEFPPIDYAENLISYLSEFGPCVSSGMGLAPVSFQEIKAWSEMTGTILTSWEYLALRELSVTYVSQHAESESPKCPAPYTSDDIDQEQVRKAMREQIKAHNQRMREKNGSR